MSKRTARTGAVLAAVVVGTVVLAACGSSDDGGDGKSEKIAGAGEGSKSASPSPSSESPEPGAPSFDLPSDVELKFDVPKTGDAVKDAVLRDTVNSAKAEREAYTKGTPGTKNLLRYFKYPALPDLGRDVKRVHDKGLTLTGIYRYYDFEVKSVAKKEAWVTYCQSERNAYGKEIKTGKILKTEPSKGDFVRYTAGLVKNAKGDWQVTRDKKESGVAACAKE